MGGYVVRSEGANGDRRTAPVSDLIRSLVADLVSLARHEADLVKIELKHKVSSAGAAVGMFVVAGLVALFGLATLIAASVLALAIVLPAWAAALIVGVVLFAVAAALVLAGRARIRAATPLTPTRSLDAAQEDMAWIRHRTEELKTSE
jgi:uncharacterized membrane protein YqjE